MRLPYAISGTVIEGRHIGDRLGFHTANLELKSGTAWPPFGVYASFAKYKNTSYQSVTHIGPRKTFGIAEPTIEVYILDFNQDLYGQMLNITLVSKIRDSRIFETTDTLRHQIQQDVLAARAILSHEP